MTTGNYLVLIPQARMTHQLETASKMANKPGTTKTRPHNDLSQTMMPVMRQIPPTTPRAMRPGRSRFGRKNLLIKANFA